MMSPLTLLSEGGIAWIVDPTGIGKPAPSHGHHHRRGWGHTSESHDHSTSSSTHCGSGRCTRGKSHLEDMGLRTGKQVQMITNSGTDPIVLKIDECRIAMRHEFGTWKWAGIAIAYQSVLAWTAAFVIYQGGRLLGF